MSNIENTIKKAGYHIVKTKYAYFGPDIITNFVTGEVECNKYCEACWCDCDMDEDDL